MGIEIDPERVSYYADPAAAWLKQRTRGELCDMVIELMRTDYTRDNLSCDDVVTVEEIRGRLAWLANRTG